ncbi:hypothetical protein JHD48_06875 [Sulfurimonas sp. SAG-AH-194-I05]|nr:hypothetical protein [Sulfurimonas sp. SAG-AH-194-I05]MDF1875453.1 hypothetical protein [Sulfurimonas sp. SAG-AH-194-I05]
MEVVKSKNFKEPIVLTKILDDGRLLIVDAKTTIRFLDKDSLDLLNGFKANIAHERYKSTVVQFSSDGKYFASLSADCKESRLYNAETKKAITKVDRHQGEASCVGISTDNKFMFSCGDDGKTFAVDMESGKLAFTLPVHVDTVNDIAFSSNGNWVATCSYDKKISIFHLAMMTPKHKLKAHAAAVMKVSFIGQNRLVSVDRNAKAIIWDIYSGKILMRLEGVHDDVTQITTAQDNKFLFLGTALGYILVYDLATYEQLSRKYIKLQSPITALVFDEENRHLIISCQNGDILFYDIYEGEAHITTLLKEKKYELIEAHVKTNPILGYTKIYELVSNLWENTLKKAKICLQKGDKAGAITLFSFFKNIPSKNRVMQKIITEYIDFPKFLELAKQGKIVLAYGVVNMHPLYKESSVYKSLEERWRKAFALAQKHSLQPKGMDTAREILAPYRGISEKTILMQELFAKGEIYKRFKVAIGQKDFKISFELTKLHPFLQEFPEYGTILNYADSLYMKSQELINGGNPNQAVKMLRVLADFPDFSAEVKELMKEIEFKKKFFDAVASNNRTVAYNMLDMSDDLLNTSDGQRLQQQWNSDLAEANSFAVEGYSKGIEDALKEYMKISSKYMAIGTVFGWCYMIQLEKAVEGKKDQRYIEDGIKNYILNFGLQDQILSFYEIFIVKYPESKLNFELLTKGSLSMWRPTMIIESILD